MDDGGGDFPRPRPENPRRERVSEGGGKKKKNVVDRVKKLLKTGKSIVKHVKREGAHIAKNPKKLYQIAKNSKIQKIASAAKKVKSVGKKAAGYAGTAAAIFKAGKAIMGK